jgi:hypothetical protein
MTVTLPPELEIVVAERARAQGISVEEYVERLVREATQREESRIGYFMVAHRPRMEGKWAWGQYSAMMTETEMTGILRRAEKLRQGPS